jgi:hypothetical protein
MDPIVQENVLTMQIVEISPNQRTSGSAALLAASYAQREDRVEKYEKSAVLTAFSVSIQE